VGVTYLSHCFPHATDNLETYSKQAGESERLLTCWEWVTGETCLALPKLNLQFLTAHDYLLRNFNLFRLEATYEIREDVADVLQRIGAARCLLSYLPHLLL